MFDLSEVLNEAQPNIGTCVLSQHPVPCPVAGKEASLSLLLRPTATSIDTRAGLPGQHATWLSVAAMHTSYCT